MTVRLLIGDCRERLREIEAGSVHCCVTSPPYFGLRDYGVDGQIGLEESPEEFVLELVSVFREVRRALRDDGTLWLNLGDSYAGGGNGGGGSFAIDGIRGARMGVDKNKALRKNARRAIGAIKPKDLIGAPWMVAFALRADGWYLRQEIIWHKPNPMPESVRDRCTKAHEQIFLLSKSPIYHYDADAIKERASLDTHPRGPGNKRHKMTEAREAGDARHQTKAGLLKYSRKLAAAASGTKNNESFDQAMSVMPEKRNKRSVWTVGSEPYSGAHFATFPPALIEPCILAGCPAGGTVLDPFGGAGTTGLVADRLGRHAILCELNPEYVAMAERRIRADAPMLARLEVAEAAQ
ncbi:MAG: site-specific DNA-methyltransferase [Magnetospirillum sp.]|nr:site-specific DNA-methyltransferase [Magnetospirillum sp.]